MFTIIRKYISSISLILSVVFSIFISIIYLPFFHNLDADLFFWNAKTLIILDGKHNHADDLKSPCFDFHEIKIINIGECLICQIFSNLRFEFSDKTSNFSLKIVYSSDFFKSSYHIFSNIYNIPLSRAPPIL